MNATQAGNGEVPADPPTGYEREGVDTLSARPTSTRFDYRKKCVVLQANRDWASVAKTLSNGKRPTRFLAGSLVNWIEGMCG
jgi:hypothetical protein